MIINDLVMENRTITGQGVQIGCGGHEGAKAQRKLYIIPEGRVGVYLGSRMPCGTTATIEFVADLIILAFQCINSSVSFFTVFF